MGKNAQKIWTYRNLRKKMQRWVNFFLKQILQAPSYNNKCIFCALNYIKVVLKLLYSIYYYYSISIV